MNMNHTLQPNEMDEKLLDKVTVTEETKEKMKALQQNLPLGGNLFFELNKIKYERDQKRRMKINDKRFEYITTVSAPKFHFYFTQ